MTKLFSLYGRGQAEFEVLPPPIGFENAPTSSQTNFEIGQIAFTPLHAPTAFYIYAGGGSWVNFTDADGPILAIAGTAPIAASTSLGTTTISMTGPANVTTLTANGVVLGQGTSAMTATTAGTAGQVLTSGGAGVNPTWTTATFPATATAGSLIAATATNVIGQIADVATGQVLTSGGVGVIPAYTGSPTLSGTLTAGTGLTSTTGNITATAGNFVSSLAGNGLQFNANTATGAAASPVVLNSRAGQVIFTSVTIAAAADVTLTITNSAITGSSTQVIYSMSGATTGSAPSIKSVTNSAGSSAIVVTNGTGATTTTADITLNFIVVN